MTILNPFLYGKPVPPARFVGRSAAVRTIFSRLYNGESTAIVGEPHIGKSSILSYIADREIQATWLRERAAKYHFAEIDCHMIPRQFSPADFWSHALADVPHVLNDDAVTRQWQEMKSSQFGSFMVKRFFESVERFGWCVVLVIDEFDVLVHHPNFDGEFFGALRSLAIRTNALATITASRVPVAEMNRRSLDLNPYGSPFFNNFAEVRLIPLSYAECRALIDTALATTELKFSDPDYALICALSGRHPYLVQVAASALFDAQADSKAERQQAASILFHDRAAAHFDDVWRHLLPTEQAILLILALRELKGRFGNEELDKGELADLRWCEPSIRQLHEAGMVDHPDVADAGPAAELLWRVASRGFVWWISDNVITRTRNTIILDSRLQEYESRGILSEAHSRELRRQAASIEPRALRGPTDVCRLLLGNHSKASAPETSSSVKTFDIERTQTMPTEEPFDVFLSHNSKDKLAVRHLADELKARGLRVWLDEWELVPGRPWQEALEQIIQTTGSVAVLVGADGLGPWETPEMRACLSQFVERKLPVIPVLLPDAPAKPALPLFLAQFTWVDLRSGSSVAGMDRLIWGITGVNPNPR